MHAPPAHARPRQTNGIFELRLKNAAGAEGVWTIDLKKDGRVYKGEAQPKPDVTLILADDTLVQIAQGKVVSWTRTRTRAGADAEAARSSTARRRS
jgi:hypothetical protein